MAGGNTTLNQAPLIKAQVFSEFMLEMLKDGLLPDGLYRDVSDFGDGTVINIPVHGDLVIRDYVQDSPIEYDPIDTGQVTLRIKPYKSVATYVTDQLKQDGYKAADIEASFPANAVYKIKEAFETDLLANANQQILNDPNNINGAAHRLAASGVNALITLDDFIAMKLAFDKANIPPKGRICIVDSFVEATLNRLVGAQAFSNNPMFEGIVTEGFAQDHHFVRHIFGWDIWTSERLPTVATETLNDFNGNVVNFAAGDEGTANVFMSVLDDQHKPFMGAWRQMPRAEGDRNKDFQRDEYVVTARWGTALQRAQSLGVVVTNADAF